MKIAARLASVLVALAAEAGCGPKADVPAAAPMTSTSVEALVDAHFAIINEPDGARRLARMPATYTTAVVFHDPGPPVSGHRAVSAAYGALQARFAGARFRREGAVLERDGMVRVGWVLGVPGKVPVHRGEDVMRLESDRIAAIWVFIQPAAPVATSIFAGIEHAGVTVPDLATATRFFHDVLGCEPLTSMGAFKTDDDWMTVHLGVGARAEVAGITMLRCGHGSNLELLQYTDPARRIGDIGNSEPGAAHLAFYTPDIEAAVARLAQHGIPTMGKPFTKTSGDTAGETFVYFRTPWDLQLELVSAPAGKAYENGRDGQRLWSPLAPAE